MCVRVLYVIVIYMTASTYKCEHATVCVSGSDLFCVWGFVVYDKIVSEFSDTEKYLPKGIDSDRVCLCINVCLLLI